MSAITATLTSLPFKQLRQNRYFYLYYDGFYVAFCLAALGLMALTGHQGVIAEWQPAHWLLLPLVTYLQIICSVFVHNACHKSFPRAINRVMGELCGVVVLTRFASWEVIHQRHHRYSDDVEKDPHPVERSYWKFLWHTIYNVEHQLQTIYFELFGDSPENRRYERRRAYVSYVTNLLLIFTWYTFLGSEAFFYLFVPASLLGFLHLVHFNWSTHNAFGYDSGGFRPINLDTGKYWIGNRIFFGIYMHKNHHDRPGVFHPLYMPAPAAAGREAPTAGAIADDSA